MNDKFKKIISNKYSIIFIFLFMGIIFVLASTFGDMNKKYETINEKYIQELELKIEHIVRSINETENCNVIISSNLEENVFTGAVITCDGGDLPYVKENVKNAVCALLDIGANKVCVIANK